MIRVNIRTGAWRNPQVARQAKPFRLLAVGDICPARGRRYDKLFTKGPRAAKAVYGNTLRELRKKDLSICNFELPLADDGEPIIKNGPNLIGPPEAIVAFTIGGFDVAGMANNHVLDYGPGPLMQTIQLARDNGMAVVGAGTDQQDASKPLFIKRAGMKVGILAFEENEFCNATRTNPGASPLYPGPNCQSIRRTSGKCDLLLVFIHGSSELCPFPSPRTIRDYRSFVDAGADVVIGHHAHTVQGMELYNGAPIVYNLGNFLFWEDPKRADPQWWKRMFVRLNFSGRRCASMDVHPFVTNFRTGALRLLAGRAKEKFLGNLNRLSEIIADPEVHEPFWNYYCTTRMDFYLGLMEREVADLKKPNPKKTAADLRNLFQCEAHCDVISNGLEMIRQGRKAGDFGVEQELHRLMS